MKKEISNQNQETCGLASFQKRGKGGVEIYCRRADCPIGLPDMKNALIARSKDTADQFLTRTRERCPKKNGRST